MICPVVFILFAEMLLSNNYFSAAANSIYNRTPVVEKSALFWEDILTLDDSVQRITNKLKQLAAVCPVADLPELVDRSLEAWKVFLDIGNDKEDLSTMSTLVVTTVEYQTQRP
ncbi:uncharacterized protein LOC143236610 isoform X1 [Tachypleus tridentatus]|uniref:uncharacterized protein LOC143236610 isoform X1 n=1 Tax=Tachypleus tridentatus TaxID=6853 RepID=UPI003FD59D9D